MHPNVHCMPSTVDVAHFLPARASGLDAEDQAHLKKPRIGYYAVIDERFDTHFIRDVARLKPDWSFVMIGPVVKISEADLPHEPNIHWLGLRQYKDLPLYMRGWNAVLMPFAINDATRYISPTKTPEFLAAGLPVVSTPVRDVVVDYGTTGLVDIAHSPEEAVAHLEAALQRDRRNWLGQVDKHLERSSWSEMWARMEALVNEELGEITEPAPMIRELANV
jgi:UDP-galactopyranose mutase